MNISLLTIKEYYDYLRGKLTDEQVKAIIKTREGKPPRPKRLW